MAEEEPGFCAATVSTLYLLRKARCNVKKKLIVLLIICLMALLLIGCSNNPNTPSDETNSPEAETENEEEEKGSEDVEDLEELVDEPIDVAAYLEELGEIKEVVTPEESKEVKSSGEIITLFDERGFVECQITAEYTMDGDYLGKEISEAEDTKHPFYEAYYLSETEEIWTINVINGTITAYPVTYNLESDREVTIIFSETPELTSYDAVTNTFFRFIPDKTVMTVVVVDKLDSNALDLLTKEEMEKL